MEKTSVHVLHNLIIFNPPLCQKEGQEHEKILFYFAREEVKSIR